MPTDFENDLNDPHYNGTLHERYAIYQQCMEDLNLEPISFDEWLES